MSAEALGEPPFPYAFTGLQTRHVRAFLAVVETGSIRTAATRLGISQPALSKTIQDLEVLLGAPLVTRSAHGSVPTRFGEAFFNRAKIVDQELRRAKEEIAQMLGEKRGNVAVGLSAISSMLMASGALARFWKEHPGARVRIVDGLFDDLLSGVRQGRFDFSIGGLPPAHHGGHVNAEPLFTNHLVPVVRRDHPRAGAKSLGELLDSDWLFTNDEPGFLTLMSEHFGRLGLPAPRVALTCQSFPTVLDIVPSTDLIAALPRSALTHELVRGRMQAIDVAEPPPTTVVALVTRVNTPLTPLADYLAREFRRAARGLP